MFYLVSYPPSTQQAAKPNLPMKLLTRIHDPVYPGEKNLNQLEKIFLCFIRDKRDLPFINLSLRITLVLLPLGILLYVPFVSGWVWWVLALSYLLLNTFYFKGPFGLMLHCTCHRKLFKKQYEWANNYLPWIVGPFFGQTPETYFSHHIGMHHPENNLPADRSCTMFYQRDSLRSFLSYFLNFFFAGILQLSSYFLQKDRIKMLRNTIGGELAFLCMCLLLSLWNWQATLVVFILPFLISRLIMMMGNWTQHAFIDPADPGNPYKNSITCINIKYNHKCWNDGYHISNHIKPTLHWTEHPEEFIRNKASYIDNRAVVFEGLDFLKVFYYLMLKRYDLLANNFVDMNGAYQSSEEVMQLLRARTKRISSSVVTIP
jgi:hypothetical protein